MLGLCQSAEDEEPSRRYGGCLAEERGVCTESERRTNLEESCSNLKDSRTRGHCQGH